MKRNFKKLLKKGICIGMAGAMIVTGSAEYLGVHPVMKAEASVADISTAKSKEEALELLCDKTVMIVQTVKEKYESILTDSENLISNYDKTSDIEREIYKEYGDVFTYVLKVKDFSKSELWNYTTKSKVCTEQQVSACKKILEKEIIQLQNYNSESLDKYNEIRASMNIKIKDLKDNGSAKWETANTANQKCMDELKGFFQNFTSKIESMKANYQELETVCSQYTDMQNKLPQNTVNPTPIVTLAPTSTVTPTSTVSYSTTRVAINIKNNAETYIKSCILTRISKGKESVHGDYNAGVSVQNGFSFGCDSNSTVTIKNITLSNGKTFPDISFWVGTTDLIYDLDLTSYEDYIVPTLKPTVTPTIKPIVTPTVEPMVTPTIKPTVIPTIKPMVTPTVEPMVTPTIEPTVTPTIEPMVTPTIEPTVIPTIEPTVTPTIEPMVTPTVEPIVTPIVEPTMTSTTEPITTQPAVTEKPVVTEKPISLKKKTIKIGRGEKVAVPLNNGTGKKITYLSKNKKIATVTSKGVVKGVKTGTTTIYVKANGKKYSLKVIVKKKPAKIKITSVKSVKMGIGDKLILQAVLNKGAASYSLTWKSSNKKVVTVNSQGVATIKGKGKATITVKTYNGFTAKLNLNIK